VIDLVIGGIGCFVLGWLWGRRTGYRDGRTAGHYEMAAVAADLRAAEIATRADFARRIGPELERWFGAHTFATPWGPMKLEPVQPASVEPITGVVEKRL
jgi:hypothetical protein